MEEMKAWDLPPADLKNLGPNPRTTPWSLFAAVLDVADVITSLQDEDVAMVGDLPFLLSSLFP